MEPKELPLFPEESTSPEAAPVAAKPAARAKSAKVKPEAAPSEGPDVIILGAGLAGLNCARELTRAGRSFVVLEASDAPGGRVRTDVVEGFRLDRGFQVLLTEYPEAQRVLDYDALNLQKFLPGALVRHGGSFHRFADPFRELKKALQFAMDPVVPFGDKLRVSTLRGNCLKARESDLFASPEETTREYLRRNGFSPLIIERFFEPFFGGIFLERNLVTSARWFRWLFKVFATGFAAVPELGMEEIPRQLAAALPDGTLQLNTRALSAEKSANGWKVTSEGGKTVTGQQLILATDELQAKMLLSGVREPGSAPPRRWNKTTTIYYAAAKPPVDEPVVVLNGEGATAGPVNHMAVMSLVAPGYAPTGLHLICANIVGMAPETDEGMETLEADVRNHLRRWFGSDVHRWQAVGGYPIAHALPLQLSVQPARPCPTDSGILLAGDYLTTASIQGALISGARAAEAALAAGQQ